MDELFSNDFEKFFVSMLDNRTNKSSSYLKLPSSNCLSGCVKEILKSLEHETTDVPKSSNSRAFIENFYNFMIKDKIMKSYDYLLYSRIMLTLKQYCENNNINKTDQYSFFEYINKSCVKKYRKNLFSTILKMHSSNIVNRDTYQLVDIFINELLASGNDYLFLNKILSFYYFRKFESFEEFVKYLFFSKADSLDIYIPISNIKEKEKHFFDMKSQKVETLGNIDYCKVYDNHTINFYYIIRENIVRIESLFNLLRFYQESQIDFNKQEKIIVKSKYFDYTFYLTFDEINTYNINQFNKHHLATTVKSLDILKTTDKQSYHKLLNVITYSEKNKNEINASAFVDNWISLETLISLNSRKKGFEGVKYFVPKMIVPVLILNDINQTLYSVRKYTGNHKMTIEHFIKQVRGGSFDFNAIDNIFYKMELEIMAEYLTDFKRFVDMYNTVETMLTVDLLRIYVLRNEYVHSSNIQAFSSMQQFKLRHILDYSIDVFFRSLNNRIDKQNSNYGVMFDTFTEVINKHETKETAIKLLTQKVNLNKGRLVLDVKFDDLNVEYETIIYNFLQNNTGLFRKYTQKAIKIENGE